MNNTSSSYNDSKAQKIEPDNKYVGRHFKSSYRVIADCNDLLDKIDGSGASEELKTRAKGEAHFLRGMVYFNLVRAFGGLPLRITPITSTTLDMPRSTVEETGEQVDDGYTSIYVNTEVKDNTKISELMECFMQKLVENTRFPHLSARVRQFKVEEEGVSVMCNIVEAYANEKAAEARAQAHEQGFEQGLEQGLEQGHEQGLEQGLEKIAYLYVKGYISYDLALEQVGSKELLDRLIASQE